MPFTGLAGPRSDTFSPEDGCATSIHHRRIRWRWENPYPRTVYQKATVSRARGTPSGENAPRLRCVRVVVPHRILLLEDNPFLAPPLVRLLHRHGYDITHVDSCGKARAVRERFDLGVFDIELPDGFGTDLSNDLLGSGTIGGVVFYTATLDGALFLHAQRIGACVRKVDGLDVLLDAIRISLGAPCRRVAGSGKNGTPPASPMGRNDQ